MFTFYLNVICVIWVYYFLSDIRKVKPRQSFWIWLNVIFFFFYKSSKWKKTKRRNKRCVVMANSYIPTSGFPCAKGKVIRWVHLHYMWQKNKQIKEDGNRIPFYSNKGSIGFRDDGNKNWEGREETVKVYSSFRQLTESLK